MIENLNSLSIDLGTEPQNIQVVKYLCCDFHMLQKLYGLVGSNGKCACIFCPQNLKDDDFDQSIDSETISELDISDLNANKLTPINITRSISEAHQLVGKNENKGYINIPLISIDFDFCVPDTLHFCLRGADKLFEILLNEISDKDNKRGTELTIANRPRLKKLEIFLKEDCKITKPFYNSSKKFISKEANDNINLTSLNSNNLQTIFLKLNPVNAESKKFSDFLTIEGDSDEFKDRLNHISAIWKAFYKIYLVTKNRR